MSKYYSSKKAFLDWDKTSSVRSRPKRILLPEYIGKKYFFPPESAPFLKHSLLADISDDEKRKVLIHQLYTYLNFTEYLEHEAICVVSYNLATKKYGFELPHRICKDARKIYVDEIYHWMFSIDFAEEIGELTGVKNPDDGEPRFLRTLESLTKDLTNSQKNIALLFFTTIAETLITPTMGKLPKDERLVLTVRELIDDHSADELRHLLFFVELFHLIWDHIEPADKHILCMLLPKMLYGYFEPDFERITLLLKEMNFTDENIQTIISDSYIKKNLLSNIMDSSMATMKLFSDVGIFEDSEVKEAFYKEGFLV